MSDIFREVEEDVRREKAARFWKAYGVYLIALAVVLLLAVAGWQVWKHFDNQRRAQAADALTAAQRITNPAQAASAYADLSKDAPSGYNVLARLAQANAMYVSGQGAPALDIYKEIAGADKGPLGAVARLRAAWVMTANTARPELARWLEPVNGDTSAWRHMAREILAFADYRAQDLKNAQAKYQALANDGTASEALRARARAMAQFLANGGASTYGTVPADITPPAPALPQPQPAP